MTSPTKKQINEAANMSVVRGLVHLAAVFSRAAIKGPFPLEMTGNFPGYIEGRDDESKNGFRRIGVTSGTKMKAKDITIGKRNGVIFSFEPDGRLDYQGSDGYVAWVDMDWSDVATHFPDLHAEVENAMPDNIDGKPLTVEGIDAQIKAAIRDNKSMHKILQAGFTKAQVDHRQQALQEGVCDMPGYGEF